MSNPILESLRRAVRSRGQASPSDTLPVASAMGENGAARPNLAAYEVLEELGRGGMGVVYRARDRRLDRIVALKIIKAGADAGREVRDRFGREAAAMACLQHPGIVQIFDVGEGDGAPFLAMEFVAAGSLAQRLKGAPLPARSAAALLEGLAQAVAYAHQRGVLHRDLTPANVLLAADGTAKITDFGLARLLSDGTAITQTGAVMGTPSYLAPEQADGQARQVGPAADVYALGAVLYECLTGRPPFHAATVLETLAQVVRDEPVPPCRLLPQLPRDLETICLKCLAKEPRQRYAGAIDLAADLRRFRDGRPIQARPVGTAERVWRWGRRNPAWAAMVCGVTGMLLAVAIGMSWMAWQLNDALEVSEEKGTQATNAELAGKHRLWEVYLAQARASRLTNRIGRRFHSLAAIRAALKLPTPAGHSLDELRTEAIASLVLPDLNEIRSIEALSGTTDYGTLDSTFERYICSDLQGNITICRVGDNAEIVRIPGHDESLAWCGICLSPDGRFLQQRFGSGLLKLWRIDRTRPVVTLEVMVASKQEWRLAFSPDSKRLALVAPDNAVAIYATDSGNPAPAPLKRWQTKFLPQYLAFHPHQNQLAVAGAKIAQVIDVATGAVGPEMIHPNMVSYLGWHPAGKVLATGCFDSKIRFWNPETTRPAREPLTHKGNGNGITFGFSHSGDFLTSTDWGALLRLWDLRTSRQVLAVPGWHGSFSHDDRQLGAPITKKHTQVWQFAPGRGLVSSSQFHSVEAGGPFYGAANADGVLLIDWDGREVGKIPPGDVVGWEGDTAFFTSSLSGLLRWPVSKNIATGTLVIGPATTLLNKRIFDRPGVSADGQIVAIPNYAKGALVWHRPNNWLALEPREDVRYCAVSADGQWIATGNHNNLRGVGATVWEAKTGRCLKDFHVGEFCGVGFSPDNRWLLTVGGGFRLWHTGSWKAGPDLKDEADRVRAFAFAHDGKMLALTGAISEVRLLETATGREVARLTVPEQTRVSPCCFSPDGTKLVAHGRESHLVYLWDLRTLRADLKELGLDWDAPAYPPAAALSGQGLGVTVDLGDAKPER